MPTSYRETPEAKLQSVATALPNYFASSEVAARYAKVRPFFHESVMERICGFTGTSRFQKALDVGCGSGQSSIALAAVADRVIAVDSSQSMLDQAPARREISYQLGVAEQLDLAGGEFDLVSVGSALHWFDQDCFFAQCRKVMAPTGVLAVYNDHFTAHMEDVVACKRWMRTRFAKRFPPPRRGMRDINERKVAECGFEVVHRSSFDHLVAFSREEFIAYLLTRSNTLNAVHSGNESCQSITDWLGRELSTIVPDGVTGSFIFKCNLWLMRKLPEPFNLS
jgi:SAM-dependent methyltransferase